jgi:hypothetical protein
MKTDAYKKVAFVRNGGNFELNITTTGKNTWACVIEEQPEARKTETVTKFINCNLRFEPASREIWAGHIRGVMNNPQKCKLKYLKRNTI